MRIVVVVLFSVVLFLPLQAGQAGGSETREIALTVPAGVPLRIYLTKRVSKRAGAAVEGKVLDPVFAFDREVVPAGSLVSGKVSRVYPVSKWKRVQSILNGDFTPLRDAAIEFDTLTLPGGGKRAIRTDEAPALASFYKEPSKKPRKAKAPAKPQATQAQNQNGGILGTVKQSAKDKINGEINARTYGVASIVRGPDRKEKLTAFLWAKSPYHPQFLRRGARIDAPLSEPLPFGTEAVKLTDLASLGAQPSAETMGRVRLLTPLDSANAKPGEPMEVALAAPLFGEGGHLALPEGTRLTGTVTIAKKARSFHRGGQLRFRFDKLELPPGVADLTRGAAEPVKPQAVLEAAESSGPGPIKVDSEGGVKAQESKTRLLAPLVSLMIASRAADNDAGRDHGASATGGETNVSGRTLGGLSGFGLLGTAVSQSSKYVGMAFGYYGLAWSVYNNVVAKGREVTFERNAMMDVRFAPRAPAPASSPR